MPHPGLLAPDSSRVFSLQRSLPTADIPEHPDRGKRINRLLVAPLRAPFKHEFDRFRTVEDEVPVRSGRDFCNILLRLRRHSRGLPPAGSRRHWEAGFLQRSCQAARSPSFERLLLRSRCRNLKGFNFVRDDELRWATGPTRGAGA